MSTTRNLCAVCDAPIGPSFLMCAGHWHLVPRWMKTEVFRTWGAVQRCNGDAVEQLQQIKEYRTARDQAVREAMNRSETENADGQQDQDAA